MVDGGRLVDDADYLPMNAIPASTGGPSSSSGQPDPIQDGGELLRNELFKRAKRRHELEDRPQHVTREQPEAERDVLGFVSELQELEDIVFAVILPEPKMRRRRPSSRTLRSSWRRKSQKVWSVLAEAFTGAESRYEGGERGRNQRVVEQQGDRQRPATSADEDEMGFDLQERTRRWNSEGESSSSCARLLRPRCRFPQHEEPTDDKEEQTAATSDGCAPRLASDQGRR